MPQRARLITRSTSTSTTSAENLNKGSALEFAELDSNLLELRDQTIGIVGDDSSGIDINAGDTLKIAGGTNITTAVVGDTVTITGSGAGGTGWTETSGNIEISTGSSVYDITLATNNAAADINLESDDIVVGRSTDSVVLLRAEKTGLQFTINNNYD